MLPFISLGLLIVQPSTAYPLPSQLVQPNGKPTVPLTSLREPEIALVIESEVRKVFWVVGSAPTSVLAGLLFTSTAPTLPGAPQPRVRRKPSSLATPIM